MTPPTRNDRRQFNNRRNYDSASEGQSNGCAINASGTELASAAYNEASNDHNKVKKGDASKVKGECAGKSPQPHRTYGDGGPKLEDDDSGRTDKGADATECDRTSKFESPKCRLSPWSCGE